MSIDEIVIDTSKKSKGNMIVFSSGKGGVGKTVISVNMAVALAKKGCSTCILDGNFQFGDVNLALDIQPAFTISDIVQEAQAIEKIRISFYVDKHKSGVNVLAAPIKPEEGDLLNPLFIKAICEKILEEYDFLIVDLPSGLCENNLAFMEMAEQIFVVTDSSFAAIKNTKTTLRTMNMLNSAEKVKVVINRYDAKSIINGKDVKRMLDVKDVSFICNNSKLVSKSFATGVPFIESKAKERICKEVNVLADELLNKRQARKNIIAKSV